jgi:hypothetical protein
MSLRDELQQLHAAHGTLTGRLLVDEARANPAVYPVAYRKLFDHGKSTAEIVDEWTVQRAVQLIRSVKVKFTEPRPPGSPKVRQFVHVQSPQGGAYEPIEKVAADPFTAALVLRQAEYDWKQFKRRYQGIREVIDMIRRDLGLDDGDGEANAS